MIKWILNWWHARQRRIDLQILWPMCKDYAHDLEEAREVFLFHAVNDYAWLSLGHEEIIKVIERLK